MSSRLLKHTCQFQWLVRKPHQRSAMTSGQQVQLTTVFLVDASCSLFSRSSTSSDVSMGKRIASGNSFIDGTSEFLSCRIIVWSVAECSLCVCFMSSILARSLNISLSPVDSPPTRAAVHYKRCKKINNIQCLANYHQQRVSSTKTNHSRH